MSTTTAPSRIGTPAQRLTVLLARIEDATWNAATAGDHARQRMLDARWFAVDTARRTAMYGVVGPVIEVGWKR